MGILINGNEFDTDDEGYLLEAQLGDDVPEQIAALEDITLTDAHWTVIRYLRKRYDYVFTTGGIGPTHDDITADSISKAFGVPCEYDQKAYVLLEKSYASRGLEFTEASTT